MMLREKGCCVSGLKRGCREKCGSRVLAILALTEREHAPLLSEFEAEKMVFRYPDGHAFEIKFARLKDDKTAEGFRPKGGHWKSDLRRIGMGMCCPCPTARGVKFYTLLQYPAFFI